ncbi:MAG: carboxypeptidase-like regulatory domain-containing protein, partial [Candidatus Acidiferrum sp.]
MSRSICFALVIWLSLFVGLCNSSAQQTLGAINGTVADASGAIVQGAKVTVRNINTNLEVTGTTKSDG